MSNNASIFFLQICAISHIIQNGKKIALPKEGNFSGTGVS